MQDRLLNIRQAAECLKSGGVIAYPTEAVFGLGCDPLNEQAVRAILSLKSRSVDAGLILLAETFNRFRQYTQQVSQDRLEVAFATWPGPVTWLFPRAPGVPDYLAGKHATIALRVSAHPVCRLLCAEFGGALVSTSANPRGQPPALSADEVRAYFAGAIAGIVEGDLGGRAQPSEIRDLASGKVVRS